MGDSNAVFISFMLIKENNNKNEVSPGCPGDIIMKASQSLFL